MTPTLTILEAAKKHFEERPDWVVFFRRVLGVSGLVRQTYATPAALSEFERSDAYAEILQMLARLRERAVSPQALQEPTRVVTVRLPKSLHEALRAEAHEQQTSMNKLCISKLMQPVASALIPRENWRSTEQSPQATVLGGAHGEEG